MTVRISLTGAVEVALDKAVLPGYSRIGPALRSRWWPADPAPGALTGKHVMVTGASSGLGRAAAAGMASLGARVHLVGRSAARLEEAGANIGREVPGADLVDHECDVSDLDAVRAFAADVSGRLS